MTIHDASDVILGWIIRGVGLLWVGGSIALMLALRRQAALAGMIDKIEAMTQGFDAAALPDPQARDAAETEETWVDRNDRRRRRIMAINGVVLGLCGLAMVLLHPFSVWLVALVVGGQGVYFIACEHAAHTAPSVDAAADARPELSTRNAGWFSLAAAGLVWLAEYRGVLS